MADEFYLTPEEIRFLGHVPDEEMFALYRASDVFLSLSEHEGFCLPLIESMIFDLPIVALDSTAVPVTLGGAGILIRTKRPDEVAELVARIAARDRARPAEADRRWPAEPAGEVPGDGPRRLPARKDQGARSHEPKIAFVVQRYGNEVMGGSELHCRLDRRAAGRARPRRHGLHDLRQGLYHLAERIPRRGVRAQRRRHPALPRRQPRDIDSFNAFSDRIFHNPHSPDDEKEWMERQGPLRPASSRPSRREARSPRPLHLLHLPLLQHLLGPEGRAAEKADPRPDGARRAGPPARRS